MTLVRAEYRSYTIYLEPVTPVHVWSGEDYIIGVDAVYDGQAREMRVLDVERIPLELASTIASVSVSDVPRVLQMYAGRIPFKLRVPSTITLSPAMRVRALSSEIVPGSTLKGYMRTAIAYYILSTMPRSDAVRALRSGVDLSKSPKDVAQGLEGRLFRAPRPRKQGGFVDAFQSLLVSDPWKEDASLEVLEFQVYEVEPFRSIASNYVVAFTRGRLRYEVRVFHKPVNPVAKDYVERPRIIERLGMLYDIDILEALRLFGCKVLEDELSRIRGVGELKHYVEVLEELRRECCEAKASCVPARIGFMTGHQAKTLLTLVRRLDPRLHGEVQALMSSHVGRLWDACTLKLTRYRGRLVGVGWCKLCLERRS